MPPFANDFVEDSALLVATTYIFLRGPVARVMLLPWVSGLIVGLLGSTEAIFPGLRFPYAVHTLACVLATAVSGWKAGTASIFVIAVAALWADPASASLIAAQCLVAISVGWIAFGRRPAAISIPAWLALCALLAQSGAILVGSWLSNADNGGLSSPWTIPANALGAFLISIVIRDARSRDLSESRRVEVEVMKRLEAEARLTSLQARLRPHFLSNALTSVAELCHIDPARASNLVIRLSKSLRRHIDLEIGRKVLLEDEINAAVEYLEIERERFGSRLRIRLDLEPYEPVLLPAFSIQTLVENSVTHGIGKTEGGEVAIGTRKCSDGTLVFVADDGSGFPVEGWRRDEAHGMWLVDQQLRNMFGDRHRIRTFGRLGQGALVVFKIPRQG